VLGETVAVKATVCPKVEGFADEVSATLEVALLTVCVRTAEMLVASLVSPL
jgi:hypothetical protein